LAEVYGTAWLENARDGISDLMDELKTSLASGYDPIFSHVYQKHGTSDIVVPAVTIGISAQPEDRPLWAQQHTSYFYIEFSIRVHTAYKGDNILIDDQKNARLINSIINKLQANRQLEIAALPSTDQNYRIDEITGASFADEFDTTTGGEVRFIVTVPVQYTQE